ncbi:alanine racemase [Microbulbifer marinus]|uniref:D-serine deaminase, pyridoxal phosphate-dependent n=1 Tax=Microbulbifer marinus TaxID=658218 RepID=A0A1H4A2S3_9GAMM|nr:alanine racemase [Microbulbifer marinus]SEA29774.1 D-serine deaminase, pyridoxal phosphate-dependent [Microbulbifer marinus]
MEFCRRDDGRPLPVAPFRRGVSPPARALAAEDFARLSRTLRQQWSGRPCAVIDLERLDHNLRCVRRHLRGLPVRLVVKSLPSIELLRYAATALDTQRLMVFHEPFLAQVQRALPGADILLGKPLPVAALRHFYRRTEGVDDRRIHWLVDSRERLQQYGQLARELGRRFSVCFEIDVGMHRGGLGSPAELAPLLDMIEGEPALEFCGFMGYDPHVAKAPPLIASRRAAAEKSKRRYRAFVQEYLQRYPGRSVDNLLLNGAGSLTYREHLRQSPVNEVSLGSCLLKPTDFDDPQLAELLPACHIAAPVLKCWQGLDLPYLRPLSRLFSHGRQSLFLYGGRWMAKPVHPRSMRPSGLFGLSSNQQLMTVRKREKLRTDDYVFFRPTQSEAVLLGFGDLVAERDGDIEALWPVLQQC